MYGQVKLAHIICALVAMILVVSNLSESASTGKEVSTGNHTLNNATLTQQRASRSVSSIANQGTILLRLKRRGGGGGGKGGGSGIGSGIASGVAGAAAGGILNNVLQG